jgi:hypothetical protein
MGGDGEGVPDDEAKPKRSILGIDRYQLDLACRRNEIQDE